MSRCQLDIPRTENSTHKARFSRIAETESVREMHPGEMGFGTLKEKRMHAILKRFFCEDSACHEVPIDGGAFIADICIGREITEIQTGSFYPMKKKIAYLLSRTDYDVTVVHPIIVKKNVIELEKKTGKILRTFPSPKKEELTDGIGEMVYLADFLPHPRLHFLFLEIEAEEYRLISGTKRIKKEKYDTVPTQLLGEISLSGKEDYEFLLPFPSGTEFTAKEYFPVVGRRDMAIYRSLHVLEHLGLLTAVSKKRNAIVWRKS